MNEGARIQKSDLDCLAARVKAREVKLAAENRLAFPTRSGEGIGKIIGACVCEVLGGLRAFEWWRWDTWVISRRADREFFQRIWCIHAVVSVQALSAA